MLGRVRNRGPSGTFSSAAQGRSPSTRAWTTHACSRRSLGEASKCRARRSSSCGVAPRRMEPARATVRTRSPCLASRSSGVAPTKAHPGWGSYRKTAVSGYRRCNAASTVTGSTGPAKRNRRYRARTTLWKAPAAMACRARSTMASQASRLTPSSQLTRGGREADAGTGPGRNKEECSSSANRKPVPSASPVRHNTAAWGSTNCALGKAVGQGLCGTCSRKPAARNRGSSGGRSGYCSRQACQATRRWAKRWGPRAWTAACLPQPTQTSPWGSQRDQRGRPSKRRNRARGVRLSWDCKEMLRQDRETVVVRTGLTMHPPGMRVGEPPDCAGRKPAVPAAHLEAGVGR